jgi:ribosomal protein S18 acetylase RimI-like enzyme
MPAEDKKASHRSKGVWFAEVPFSAYVISENKLIGCGRVIRDGDIYFYIQDIGVLPKFQGRGIGKRIINAIMEYLKANTRDGAFTGLMTAKRVHKFCEQYVLKNFRLRP